MGVVSDLVIAALALTVVASLALLAWTIAIGGGAIVDRARVRVADVRTDVAETESRLRGAAR